MPPGRRKITSVTFDAMGDFHFQAGLKGRPAVQGHRGAGYMAPPNSMESMVVASQLKLDSVEFDVWMLKCGSLIVAHGPEVILPGDLGLRKYSLKELIDEEEEFSMFHEVVQFCQKKNMKMNIEIKGDDPSAVDEVLRVVNSLDATSMSCVSSFEPALLQRVLDLDSTLAIGVLHDPYSYYSDNPTFIPSTKKPLRQDFCSYLARPGDSVNLAAEVVTPQIVEEAHKHGIRVMAWFACVEQVPEGHETLVAYERLIRAGVDVICCNHPQRLQDYLDARFLDVDSTSASGSDVSASPREAMVKKMNSSISLGSDSTRSPGSRAESSPIEFPQKHIHDGRGSSELSDLFPVNTGILD